MMSYVMWSRRYCTRSGAQVQTLWVARSCPVITMPWTTPARRTQGVWVKATKGIYCTTRDRCDAAHTHPWSYGSMDTGKLRGCLILFVRRNTLLGRSHHEGSERHLAPTRVGDGCRSRQPCHVWWHPWRVGPNGQEDRTIRS